MIKLNKISLWLLESVVRKYHLWSSQYKATDLDTQKLVKFFIVKKGEVANAVCSYTVSYRLVPIMLLKLSIMLWSNAPEFCLLCLSYALYVSQDSPQS